jgi:hypothetical protein
MHSQRSPSSRCGLGGIAGSPASAQEVNESGLWFGGDEGVEVVWQPGKNLAFTDDHPNIDSRMTKFARTFEQALLKLGERTYLAFGFALTSPMMVE